MMLSGDLFAATVQIPQDSTLDYGFLIARHQAGAPAIETLDVTPACTQQVSEQDGSLTIFKLCSPGQE
jgi:hypothetical protein